MTSVNCGLIGCGTVGGGVVQLWEAPGQAPGARLSAVAVRDVAKARAVNLAAHRLTGDAWELVRDDSLGLLIEATGDTDLAYALALESFRRGKSFVIAGKGLVSRYGPELEERAAAQGVAFRYEAAAGGALPIVALLRLGLSPGPVRGFEGVLNGTCNFVLSRLDEGVSFETAIESARRLGLAEADSSRDISGRDTAEKLVVLAHLCGIRLSTERVPTRGIEGLAPLDATFGRRRGWALRLVATLRVDGGPVIAEVQPSFVPRESLLAQARDEENVVLLDGDERGRLGLVGRGAGSLPTAAAILADVRDALVRPVGGHHSRPGDVVLAESGDPAETPHYVRVTKCSGAARDLVKALAAVGVGIDFITSDCPARVQALTAPAPAALVGRALAPLAAREKVHVVVRDSREGSRYAPRAPLSSAPPAA